MPPPAPMPVGHLRWHPRGRVCEASASARCIRYMAGSRSTGPFSSPDGRVGLCRTLFLTGQQLPLHFATVLSIHSVKSDPYCCGGTAERCQGQVHSVRPDKPQPGLPNPHPQPKSKSWPPNHETRNPRWHARERYPDPATHDQNTSPRSTDTLDPRT